MAVEPGKPTSRSEEAAEYRRRQDARARRRKKRQQQRLIFLGICVLGVVILVLVIVMIVRNIVGGDDKPKADPKLGSDSSAVVSGEAVSGEQPQGGYSLPAAADPAAWNLLLVNARTPLAEGYTFEEATVSQNGVGYIFDARIVDELERMLADCNAVEDNSLRIISGSRGPSTQNGKYEALVEMYKSQGNEQAEAEALAMETDPPYGQSDHQTGLAVDFITADVTEASLAFAETPEYQWLLENAQNYGFILRFPETKNTITGISYQPYHFRYVGAEDARIITQAGICLEEYVSQTAPPVVDTPASAASASTAEAAASAPASVPTGDTAG